MKSSLTSTAWILGLLCLSCIAGFMTVLNANPYIPGSEYLIFAVTGTVAVVIVIGGISLIVLKRLKKKGNPSAGKRALQCYSVLVLVVAFVQAFQFNSTIRKRDRMEFLAQFNAQLTAFVYEKIDHSLYPGIDEDVLAENVDDYIRCIESDLERNAKLLDRLMEADDKKSFMRNNEDFKQIEEYCIGYIGRKP